MLADAMVAPSPPRPQKTTLHPSKPSLSIRAHTQCGKHIAPPLASTPSLSETQDAHSIFARLVRFRGLCFCARLRDLMDFTKPFSFGHSCFTELIGSEMGLCLRCTQRLRVSVGTMRKNTISRSSPWGVSRVVIMAPREIPARKAKTGSKIIAKKPKLGHGTSLPILPSD